jgi:hypothetical protein
MSNSVSRSWFAVFNQPENHGYNGKPEQIVERLKHEWIQNSNTRSGAWVYCISAEGLRHVHMVLEDSKPMRFSKIKKTYAISMHFEETKGSKNQIEAYIKKLPPFEEKGEQIICMAEHGSIQGASLASNRNIVYTNVTQWLDQGLKPTEIMAFSLQYRKEEALIRKEFFARKLAATPPRREVEVYWHIGDTRSGKTYTYIKLCETYGEDNIYMYNDYCSGGLDNYCAEPILFMDEFKGDLKYQVLLNMLEGYKMQIHCRYANAYALWTTVHITSIYPPEKAYELMVTGDVEIDTIEQLLCRITTIVYHWREDDKYFKYEMPASRYKNYDDLKKLVHEETYTQLTLELQTEVEQLFSNQDKDQ